MTCGCGLCGDHYLLKTTFELGALIPKIHAVSLKNAWLRGYRSEKSPLRKTLAKPADCDCDLSRLTTLENAPTQC